MASCIEEAGLRQFGQSGFKIWNLAREAKLLYTFFALFALAAYAVSVLYYEDLVGAATVAGARGYYGGRALPEPNAAPIGGPHIELPAEAAQPPREPISYRHLLEVTHFHLFTLPVFLLIVAHLFMLTGLDARWKLFWIVLGGGSSLAHVAAPWWARGGGTAGAAALLVSGALMLGSLTVMTVYAVYAMWRGPSAERAQ